MTTPTDHRRRATRLQIISVVLGVVAAVVLCCAGIGLNVMLMDVPADTAPGTTIELQTHPVGGVLYAASALALVSGFGGVWLIGRRAARARGEQPDSGRPPLSWRTLISPRGASRLLFVPRGVYQVDDELMGRLGLARSVLGVAIIAVAVATNDPGQVGRLPGQLVTQGLNALIVGSVVLVLCCLTLLMAAPAAHRATARRAMLRPAATLAYTWLVAAGFLLYLTKVLEPWAVSLADDELDLRGAVLSLIFVGHVAWVVAFFCFSLSYIARYVFNSGDAHPGLPALAAIVLSWTFIALSLATLAFGKLPVVFGDVDLPIPGGLSTALSFGGACSVTALAVVELIRLRRRGYGLRTGRWQ